jgi:threonine/homoserine/homoserine lactone efflux protein
MPEPSAFALFLAATLALNLTPGPDMLYITARSVGQGRAAGVLSALGVTAGCLVHTAAAALGVSALFASSAAAYEALRYAGAAYLVYLGIRTLRAPDAQAAVLAPRLSPRRVFWQGVTTNVLNPKVALFFLAFLPQFADAGRGPVAAQIVLLGLVFNLSGTLVNVAVALAAGGLGDWLGRRPGVRRLQQRLTGALFIALGLRLAVADFGERHA